MSFKLLTRNNGPEILSSTFWQSEGARRGIFHLSSNAGAFRLLVPQVQESVIAEMRTAREVVVSRGPWPAQRKDDALEILFDDGTDNHFALHLSIEQTDRLPLAENAAQKWTFTAWTLQGGEPAKVLTLDCYYRLVPDLPYLKERDV